MKIINYRLITETIELEELSIKSDDESFHQIHPVEGLDVASESFLTDNKIS